MARRWRWWDRRGVAAIETALVLTPFVTLLIGVLETGVYFTNQFSLDTGVLVTAETQSTAMMNTSPYSLPSVSTLKSSIATNGGSLVGVSNMIVDVRLLTNLTSSAVPISDGTQDIATCAAGDILVLRAQASVKWLVAGFATLTIASSAIMRCPNTA
jgi:Flp pilus assembly protein TadG